MKNLIVANYRPHGKQFEADLRRLVNVQIENSLALGWGPDDLVIVSNLEFDCAGVKYRTGLNESCLTGSKMFALKHMFDEGIIQDGEMWWAHDLDAWQNYWFDAPDCLDMGLAEYSVPKFNGGSVFLRRTAHDLVTAIVERIQSKRLNQEEPSINHVLRSQTHAHRVTTLNSTYNVGCSAYAPRYERSLKPILVSHFRPTTQTSWKTHVDGNNLLGISSVSPRLLQLLIDRFYHGVRPRFPHNKSSKQRK